MLKGGLLSRLPKAAPFLLLLTCANWPAPSEAMLTADEKNDPKALVACAVPFETLSPAGRTFAQGD